MNFLKSNKGMTLMEVMVVLLIMGIVVLSAYPLFTTTNSYLRENVVVSQIEGIIHTAIGESKRTSSYIDVKILTDSNLFIIEGEKTYEEHFYQHAIMDNEGEKLIQINPRGIIDLGTTFTFKLNRTSYEVIIEPGREEVKVNKL